MHLPVATAVVLLLALRGAEGSAVAADESFTKLSGDRVMQTEAFLGISKWRLLQNLWTERTVNVSCPGHTDFSVYKARSASQLADAVAGQRSAWCGLSNVMSWDATNCVVSLSPFHETTISVVHPTRRSSAGFPICSFKETTHFSKTRAVMGLVGVILFMRAGTLVDSLAFRLGTGTGFFVMLSILILTFIVYRTLPNKKSLVATIALFGTTVATVTKYLAGQWLLSMHDIIYNKWMAGYVALSALMGLALTYYFDDPKNHKLNVILQRGLQLAGLALVWASPSLMEAGIAAVCVMVSAYVTRASRWSPFSRGIFTGGSDTPRVEHDVKDFAKSNMFPSIIERNGRHRLREESHSNLAESSWSEESSYESDGGKSGTRSQSRYSRRSDVEPTSDTSEDASLDSSQAPLSHSRMSAGLARGHSHSQQLSAPSAAPTSPLVQRGLIFNEASGRTIQMGKPTFKRLVNSGYQVDAELGTLTPPGRATGRILSGNKKRRPATSAQTAPLAHNYGLSANGGSQDVSVANPAASANKGANSRASGR